MKWSKYNYFFKINSTYLLYNSLSNGFAELKKNTYQYLQRLIKLNDTNISDKLLNNELITFKALVEDDKDEINLIKYKTNSMRFDKRSMALTINPTMHCNFNCSYCFESNRSSIYMTDDVEDAIITFIKNQKGLESLNVTWFGGEPLMDFNRIVSISKKIQSIEINYKAGLITNGYLLSKQICNQLDELNIKFVQITIDGLSQTHNLRRHLTSGEGTFDKIIENIECLKKINSIIDLSIRVNIDDKNKDEFILLFNFFKDKNYENVNVVPAFVDDIGNGCKSNDCLFDRKLKIEFITDLYKNYGLNFSYFYPRYDRMECSVRNANSFVIGASGELYKCWNDVGNQSKILANLVDKKVKINHKLHLRYLAGADPMESAECHSCFHFPTCSGGCPYLRIENEYEGKHFDTCDYIKDNMNSFLEMHYHSKNLII